MLKNCPVDVKQTEKKIHVCPKSKKSKGKWVALTRPLNYKALSTQVLEGSWALKPTDKQVLPNYKARGEGKPYPFIQALEELDLSIQGVHLGLKLHLAHVRGIHVLRGIQTPLLATLSYEPTPMAKLSQGQTQDPRGGNLTSAQTCCENFISFLQSRVQSLFLPSNPQSLRQP